MQNFIQFCKKGRVDKVNSLIQEGADIEAKDEFGKTGFWYACEKGHIKVIDLLIKNGVNIAAKDNKFCTSEHKINVFFCCNRFKNCFDLGQIKIQNLKTNSFSLSKYIELDIRFIETHVIFF